MRESPEAAGKWGAVVRGFQGYCQYSQALPRMWPVDTECLPPPLEITSIRSVKKTTAIAPVEQRGRSRPRHGLASRHNPAKTTGRTTMASLHSRPSAKSPAARNCLAALALHRDRQTAGGGGGRGRVSLAPRFLGYFAVPVHRRVVAKSPTLERLSVQFPAVMTSIKTLNRTHVDEIERLRAGNTNTLGFLPKSAIAQQVDQGGGIGLWSRAGRLLGYILLAFQRQHVRIIHLCVDDKHRRRGYAKRMVEAAIEKAKDRNIGLIKLNCRRDYDAHAIWPVLGFVPLDETDAKTPGRRLTQWCLGIPGYGQPDIFDAILADDKVNATIDTQILLHLGNPLDETTKNAHALQADFLSDRLELHITDEAFIDIDRSGSKATRSRSRAQAHAFHTIKHDRIRAENTEKKLRLVLPAKTKQALSDIRHIAKTSASDIDTFITLDEGILKAADKIYRCAAVRVVRPYKLIMELHEAVDGGAYEPSPVSGIRLAWKKLKAEDSLRGKRGDFLAPRERRELVYRRLDEGLSLPDMWDVEGLWKGQVLLAIRMVSSMNVKDERMTVKLCRVSRRIPHHQRSLFDEYTVSSLLHEAVKRGQRTIEVLPECMPTDSESTLQNMGFFRVQDRYVRACPAEVMNSDELYQIIDGLGRDEISDGNMERESSPVVLEGDRLPCIMVPIKPGFARDLFDMDGAADDLFGAKPEILLRWGNAYYRRKGQHLLIKAPARILWYVSKSTSCVVAVSHLDKVMFGTPKEMFRENRNLGTLEWKHIWAMCKGDFAEEIMVLRFSNSFQFRRPVQLEELRSIYRRNGRKHPNLQSPTSVPNEVLAHIFQAGFPRRNSA